MKSRAGNIDSSYSKLSQSNAKGLLKIPFEFKCHIKCGSGSRPGHVRSPKSKILFRACGTWFLVTFARRIQKSKPFCNLTPCKSTTKNGQVNPGSYNVSFSNAYFWLKMSVSEPVWSQGSKNVIFSSCTMSRNAQNRSLKKWQHQQIRFLG